VRAAVPSKITIWFLTYIDKESITFPDGYIDKYTIPVDGLSGNKTFTVKQGSSAIVTDGVIQPKVSYEYCKQATFLWACYSYPVEGYQHYKEIFKEGLTTITVTADGFTQDINVTVKNYATEYVNKKAAKIIKDVAYSGLTEYQKLYNITKWVGHNTIYNTSFTSATNMLIHEKGDCWASTSTIVFLGKMAGLDCRGRDGSQDSGAGSLHSNAVARIGDRYYVGEAGYYELRKPRTFTVYELPLGYSISGNLIYQYDGDEKHIKLPSELNGKTITKLGRDNIRVFLNGIESLRISETIESIGKDVLSQEPGLTKLTVDPRNKNFSAYDDALYTADQTVLTFTIRNKTSLSISPKARKLATGSLSKLNLETLVVPGTVKNFSQATFSGSTIHKMKIAYGVEVMEGQTFQGLNTPQLFLPDSIILGEGTFLKSNIPYVFLPKGGNLVTLPNALFQQSKLKRIEIPAGVKTIGNNVFYQCSDLEKVYIPDSVTQIGTDSFSESPKLTDIYYQGSEQQWNKIDFLTPIGSSVTVHFDSEMWVETIVDWDLEAASTYRNLIIVAIWALINFVFFIAAY